MARPEKRMDPVRIHIEELGEELRQQVLAGNIEWVDDPETAELVLRGPDLPTPEAVRLTGRELEILGYLADGWSNDEISSRLRISPATVKFHLAGMYRKFGVRRRTEAVREGMKMGMIEF